LQAFLSIKTIYFSLVLLYFCCLEHLFVFKQFYHELWLVDLMSYISLTSWLCYRDGSFPIQPLKLCVEIAFQLLLFPSSFYSFQLFFRIFVSFEHTDLNKMFFSRSSTIEEVTLSSLDVASSRQQILLRQLMNTVSKDGMHIWPNLLEICIWRIKGWVKIMFLRDI
jgi:hypothetical protein